MFLEVFNLLVFFLEWRPGLATLAFSIFLTTDWVLAFAIIF
jgi:hypothetical protein